MASSVGRLTIAFGANMKGFDSAMKKAQRNIGKFGGQMKKTGRGLTMGLTAPLLAFAGASVKAFDTQIRNETKLLTSLGGRTDIQQRLIKQAKELQGITLYGDEETIAAQAMLASMGLEEEAIRRLIPLVQDMATLKGMDLVQASDLVAKSVGSSTNALSRYGIEIKGAVGSSERLDSAVGALTVKFKGQAEAIAGEGLGAWKQLQNALGDVSEEFGKIILENLVPLKTRLQDVTKWLSELSSETKESIVKWGAIAAVLGPVIYLFGALISSVGTIIGFFMRFKKVVSGLFLLMRLNPIGLAITGIALGIGWMTKGLLSMNTATKQTISLTRDLTKEKEKLATLNRDELKAQKLSLQKELGTINERLEQEREILSTMGSGGSGGGMLLEGPSGEAIEANTFRLQDQKKIVTDLTNQWNVNKDLLTEINSLLSPAAMPTPTPTGGGGVGGKEEDLTKKKTEEFNEMKTAYADALTEMDNRDKQRYLEGLDSKDQYLANLEENEAAFLEKSKELYNEYGEDISEIDGQILDGKIANMEATEAQMSIMDQALQSAGERMGASFAQGAASFKEFGNAMGGIMKDVIGATISQGVAAAVANALHSAKFLPPYLIPVVAGLAAGLAKTAFNTLIPSFAAGGIVSGPTMGLMGEYAGAGSNPEVIAPLDKLKSMMGGMSQKVEVVGKISGNDIWLSNQRTGMKRFRSV